MDSLVLRKSAVSYFILFYLLHIAVVFTTVAWEYFLVHALTLGFFTKAAKQPNNNISTSIRHAVPQL